MTCRTYLSGDGPVVTGPAGQRLNNSGVVADVWEIFFCEDRQVIADGDRKRGPLRWPRDRDAAGARSNFWGDVALFGFRDPVFRCIVPDRFVCHWQLPNNSLALAGLSQSRCV